MNFGTKLRTILAVATSLNTALMATDITEFGNGKLDMAYKIVSIVLNFVIVACVTYYNNDYTEIACEQTGELRLRKAEKKGINGEYFYEEGKEQKDEPESL
jgi:hypothetical protein